MPSPKYTQTRAKLDELYAGVAVEQIARLKEFRRSHPVKKLTLDGTHWEYIACGRGEQTLLLLPGALSVGESLYPIITAFENEYRVIAPSYALSSTMTRLCAGINQILETEGADKVHLMGGSYGGLVAQCFVRKHPDKVSSLILSHTFVMKPQLATSVNFVGKLLPLLPESLFSRLLKLRLNGMVLSTLRRAKHEEQEFWKAYLSEAVASGRLREVAIHQNKCLSELAREPQFTAADLKGWRGMVLIIDSDDDPAIPAKDRQLLRATYPQAEVCTFRDAGHASSILKRDEVVAVIKDFVRRVELYRLVS